MTLTNAQIYTLRRLNTGTLYLMQGNGKKGMEQRPDCLSTLGYFPVNAPSLPPLFRLGLIEFTLKSGLEQSCFYRVRLTGRGQELATTAVISVG
ncbi:hypothetical protein A3X26_12305 [Salmonella enterica subsp. enterica serovar Typhimurium]|uniref:Uncharacterized protein n=2 Tax=Enterobacteriaceae TaxID=543 RepID=A0A706EPD1_SALTM|nr:MULTISPECIES: hypothetical protein [Enterobacteriaceae]EAU5545490.1 hypothetical protein [Salmonella enterica]EBI0099374.1 hypothetical protein [Salmonella enterica subsp. enterica serovar Johannesburg]EKS9204961.1 hypothetical protein [Enterobacter cloacae]HAT7706546.1 hypothetical protein [Enterobacter roggenkampii]HBM2589285.1 hypothetical protein [Enterobacter hormaechei subsp. hoffmannii]HDP0141696.1 hypothetical protein [Salmonella enterica subsp. enterica serovar Concord]